jgi:hypothetical protein
MIYQNFLFYIGYLASPKNMFSQLYKTWTRPVLAYGSEACMTGKEIKGDNRHHALITNKIKKLCKN